MIYKAIAKDDMPHLNCTKCGAKGKVVLKYKPQVEQKPAGARRDEAVSLHL